MLAGGILYMVYSRRKPPTSQLVEADESGSPELGTKLSHFLPMSHMILRNDRHRITMILERVAF
eukprot:scaffold6938_cov108-Cylindrotheca_fusiformis.AAC.2